MTKRGARRIGAVDGMNVVETYVQEHGERALLECTLSGWEECATGARAHSYSGIQAELAAAYYKAYDRAARRTHRRLRHQIEAKIEHGETLDAGIYGEPESLS